MEAGQARLIANRIACGHAYDKHVVKGDDFPEVKSRREYEDLIWSVLTDSKSHDKTLDDGRQASWNEAHRALVIIDWWSEDGGTAIRPRRGRAYYRQLE